MKTFAFAAATALAAVLAAACIPLPYPGPETDPDSRGWPSDERTDRTEGGVFDRQRAVYEFAVELEQRAAFVAQSTFDHFRGWNNTITEAEQAVLFRTESFAASCRLFNRLAETTSGYYSRSYLRTNIYSAFLFLARSFNDLEVEMRRGGWRPFELEDCRRLLDRIEREFRSWPESESLISLDGKYVKGRNATVYLIERESAGTYIRRPFKNLESLFKYHYDRKRGKNPWEDFVEVEDRLLGRMKQGRTIALTFEGLMVVAQGEGRNRPVYLIEKGRRRGLTRPELVDRYGGWGNVFEVPQEVIDAYPEGPPVESAVSGHIKK